MAATKYEKGGKRVNIFNQGDIKGNAGGSFRRAWMIWWIKKEDKNGQSSNYETLNKLR